MSDEDWSLDSQFGYQGSIISDNGSKIIAALWLLALTMSTLIESYYRISPCSKQGRNKIPYMSSGSQPMHQHNRGQAGHRLSRNPATIMHLDAIGANKSINRENRHVL